MFKPVAARDAFRRLAAWLSSPSGMVILFVSGLIIRLILARGGGFPFDMPSFQAWASRLADRGPWHFYPGPGENYFVDYPPGYLYVLWILGLFSKAVGGGALTVFQIKMPPVFADLALAWLVSLLAHRLTPSSLYRRAPVRGLAAAAILLNPAIFFISAVWGQVDAFLAVPVVGAFLLLGTGVPSFRREAPGMGLLALAVGTKPQGAFVLPMVVLFLVWRHMHAREGRYDLMRGLGRVVSLAGVGIAAGLLLLAPFRLGPLGALSFYARSGRTYPVTSVFAFNVWGGIQFWRHDYSGEGVLRILGFPALYWGLLLAIAGGTVVLARAWAALRRGEDEGRVLTFGSIAITIVGFALLTRIHERYLFLPLALAAAFVGIRWLRRAFAALSVLYLINVYFPYVYYLRFKGRPATTFGGLFDAFYGTDFNGVRMKVLCAVITAGCLFIAWRGWLALQRAPAEVSGEPVADSFPIAEEEPERPERWTLALHPVGRRGALLALAVFFIAFISRVAMLGHPPGMYFDEVYHARTGAEYLGGKEVFEWTHPPLGKELIGFSIQHLSNFGTRGSSRAPSGLVDVEPAPHDVVWIQQQGSRTVAHRGSVDGSCSLKATGRGLPLRIHATAIAATEGSAFVGGTFEEGATLVRYDGPRAAWAAALPSTPKDIALAGERTYVLTDDGQLVSVSPEGVPKTVAIDATAISQASADHLVWAAFAKSKRVASWDADGKRQSVIETPGEPTNIAAIDLADRVYVDVGDSLVSIESDDRRVQTTLSPGAEALAAVPETGILWAARGNELRAIEPHAVVAIGTVHLQEAPTRLTSDPVRHQIVAIAGSSLECASGRPQFAWRLGSAIFGSGMVAMVALLCLLLFGSSLIALLASLFLAVDGVAFTVSRIAMVDSYSIAFFLAAWFCALSALRSSSRRASSILWLSAGGVLSGLALASKWVALYALAGIVIVFVWDAFARKQESIWRVAGSPLLSAAIIVFLYAVVPLAIYAAAYRPYFALGHSFSDLLKLQRDMYNYHAHLTASHPFGSPWFGWPVGYRAVFFYLKDDVLKRSEIWTIPNLVLFWGAFPAMFFLVRRALRTRSTALAVVAFAGAMQYLPWVAVSRVTFMYHYLGTIPFLAIAVGWWLVDGLRDVSRRREIAIGVAVAAVVYFLVLLPMLVGWSVPDGYLDGVRHLMPWVIK